MCLSVILKLFQKQKPNSQYEPLPEPSPSLVLLHPEEPMNPQATASNTSVTDVLSTWFESYNVPIESRDYFSNAVDIKVYDSYPTSPNDFIFAGCDPKIPAMSWGTGGIRHIACLAPWLNPGVVAHEQAHNSYSLMTEEQKAAFTALWDSTKNTDPKLVYLWSKNTYGTTSDIEGHAECYRYWGSEMPEELKQYYPKLF